MYNLTMDNNEILVFLVYFSEAVVPNSETVFKSDRQGLISLRLQNTDEELRVDSDHSQDRSSKSGWRDHREAKVI